MLPKDCLTTVRNVENDASTNDQADDLDSISNGLQLSSSGGAKSHVADDDGREGVDNTVRDGAVNRLLVNDQSFIVTMIFLTQQRPR